MPYPQHNHIMSASEVFRNSQRPPAGSHLSAWLHGDSTVVHNHLSSKSRPTGMRKATHIRSVTAPVQRPRGGLDSHHPNASSLRPRASTLSVIDPVHSPVPGPRPPAAARTVSTDFYEVPRSRYNSTHPAFVGAAPLAAGPLQESAQRKPKRKHRHHHRRHATYEKVPPEKNKKPPPFCFPHITDSKIRQKSIGTLISGTLLTLVLTTYLALALSSAIPTPTFHAVFILFILLLTIAFAHQLTRLCMLAFGPRARWHSPTPLSLKKPLSHSVSAPLRISTPNLSRRPIRLLPPYHDEDTLAPSPLHPPHPPTNEQQQEEAHNNNDDHDDDDNTSMRLGRPLPAAPPPPAYGRWRDSVRVDPERGDLQQLTRELAMAEAGWAGRGGVWQSRGGGGARGGRQGSGSGGGGWTVRGGRSDRDRERERERAPPSYDGIFVTSDVHVVDEARRPVLAPAPLFTRGA